MPATKSKDQILLIFISFFLRCFGTTQAGLTKNLLDLPFELNSVEDDVSLSGSVPTAYVPNEDDLSKSSELFTKFLLSPWPKGMSPFLYVEKPGSINEYMDKEPLPDLDNDVVRPTGSKRSKYYRKYPWKRQQANIRYEPAYMCIPGKDDIYRLLVALHGERDGPRGQLVDFCNRKRPASFVFTNIRYVG